MRLFAILSSLVVAATLFPRASARAGEWNGRPPALPVANRSASVLTPPALALPLPAQDAKGKIKHVVIIMQENRSFDDMFQGYPGADTQPYGYDSHGNKIALRPIPLEANYDIEHDIYSFITACNGTGSVPGTGCAMNGFNNEANGCYGPGCTDPQYGYVPESESHVYFEMAKQYVLADHMFASDIDDSFISHQYIISAQANGRAYFPNSAWGCEGGPSDTTAALGGARAVGPPDIPTCWDVTTLGDELDQKHLPWRYYASSVDGDGGIWSAYQAIKHIYYGADWKKDVISPQNRILKDVPAGTLPAMTWVLPTCATSDHSGCGENLGPAWVASVVNTIGESKFWKSTAIFVFWDEWGGWYDHVPPPYVDADGLGMRVGLLVISPYAKQNYVSHVQYEHGSLLRFAEDQFGLARLSAADARANSPAVDCFDFGMPPRAFRPFSSPVQKDYFLTAPPDTRMPDTE